MSAVDYGTARRRLAIDRGELRKTGAHVGRRRGVGAFDSASEIIQRVLEEEQAGEIVRVSADRIVGVVRWFVADDVAAEGLLASRRRGATVRPAVRLRARSGDLGMQRFDVPRELVLREDPRRWRRCADRAEYAPCDRRCCRSRRAQSCTSPAERADRRPMRSWKSQTKRCAPAVAAGTGCAPPNASCNRAIADRPVLTDARSTSAQTLPSASRISIATGVFGLGRDSSRCRGRPARFPTCGSSSGSGVPSWLPGRTR